MTLLRSPIHSPIRSPIYNPLVGKWGAGFTDYGLFGPSDDGFVFGFSKLDRLFQDVSGTIPVAVDADPIALALDGHSWGGKTLAQVLAGQAELVTNGGFDADANWTKEGGWSISGGQAARSNTGASTSLVQNVSLVAGRIYRVAISILSLTSGNLTPRFIGGVTASGPVLSSAGDYVVYIQANTGNTQLQLIGNSTFAGSIDNVSIKAIPGNHGTQATTSARPFWKTPNFARLDGADDHLKTPWLPTPSFTFATKAKMPSSSATKLIMGASDGTGVAGIGIRATTGLLCASIGLTGTTTINGGNDVSGQIGVAAVTVSGTSVVLYWNRAPIFSGSFSGPIPTAQPVYLGAYNSVGAAGLFADVDLYNALAINRALSPAEVLNLTNYWNAQ